MKNMNWIRFAKFGFPVIADRRRADRRQDSARGPGDCDQERRILAMLGSDASGNQIFGGIGTPRPSFKTETK